jgi:hypothetical protein
VDVIEHPGCEHDTVRRNRMGKVIIFQDHVIDDLPPKNGGAFTPPASILALAGEELSPDARGR